MKRVLIHSNFCRAFTGFGKNKKNIMRYLFDTGKYELIELANGLAWDHPKLKTVPWECRGALPPSSKIMAMSEKEVHEERYGFSMVDRAIKEFKPDVYIGTEDVWAFKNFHQKPWWNKVNSMIWTTLDSLPILPQAIELAPKTRHYYVWSSFAEQEMRTMGYDHIETLHGSIDTDNFFRFSDKERAELRSHHDLEDEFIIGFVFRNQLRKSVPNLLDGFKFFKERNPNSNARLLLHTHWKEGWDINRLIKEKNINPSDILTTYICSKCGIYKVESFSGEEINCPCCHSEKSLSTTNISNGVNESQLNEIYNLMDVYCHPFTSGGQEIPIQEAKLTELVTLVTDYSCGKDNCTEESGGLPLLWSEYREPGTQFIKATTCPESICKQIETVFRMDKQKASEMGSRARKWVIDNFSIEVIGKKIEKIIDSMPDVVYDYESETRNFNFEYNPPNGLTVDDLVVDIYKNILDEDVDKNSEGLKHWVSQIRSGIKPVDVINHFKNIASQQLQKKPSLEELIDKTENEKIAIIIPGDETDVLFINSLIEDFKQKNPNSDIYVFTKLEFYVFIEDNENIHKILPYSEIVENTFMMEGIGSNKGIFDKAYYPATTTQKNPCYIHNGK